MESDNSMDGSVEMSENMSETMSETNEVSTEEKPMGNPAWADAMRKILNTKKQKRKKSIVLSKAKILKESPEKEIVVPKEEIKVEVKTLRQKDSDKLKEKQLIKIATRGVVQLFNNVRKQQQNLEEKKKPIKKKDFLEDLKKSQVKKDEDIIEVDKSKKEEKVWSVLRDDFVMGNNLKDWDKKDDEDEGDSSAPEVMDDDD